MSADARVVICFKVVLNAVWAFRVYSNYFKCDFIIFVFPAFDFFWGGKLLWVSIWGSIEADPGKKQVEDS